MSVMLYLPPSTSTSMPSQPLRDTPCRRYFSASAASSALFSTRQPPSEVVMFLLAWKLNETKSPNEPIGFPCQVEPMAVSYTHLRAHETVLDLVCRLLLE